MWDKVDESFDFVVSAPDKQGNVKVKLTFLPTGTTHTKICVASDINKTKASLKEAVTKEAKKVLAEQKGKKGSSASKLI